MVQTIGIIETRGLAISIRIADAMLKAAEVMIVRQETLDIILVTIAVQGDISAVTEAIKIGVEIAKEANAYVSSHIISNPDMSTLELVEEKAQRPK